MKVKFYACWILHIMDKSFAQIPVRRFHKSSYQLEGQLSFDVFMIKLVWIENVVKGKN